MIFSRIEPGGHFRALRMRSGEGRWELGMSLFAAGPRLRMGRTGEPPKAFDFCLGRSGRLYLPVFEAVLRRLRPLSEESSLPAIDAVFPWAGTRPDLGTHLEALLDLQGADGSANS